MKRLSLLGSTGSIGTQTLDVIRGLKGTDAEVKVEVLAAHSNGKRLEEQMRAFSPAAVAVFDEAAAKDLKDRTRDLSIPILVGMDGLCEAAAWESADCVLNSVVGMVGLQPTLAAIEAKKTVALANKETLVAGGALVKAAAKEAGVSILPVDSEHSAIFQCLEGKPGNGALKKIILTASGGPFFGKSKAELQTVTPAEALNHPNWDMGAKVTIDSATMMNKGLEVIEAFWLFDLRPEQIDVLVHRESIVHSLVEYEDHSVIAQLGVPDMRIPIQYALTYPNRYPSPVRELNLWEAGNLSFYQPDLETFRCLSVCMDALKRGGLAPAAANGANERAVELFLQGKIGFLQIAELVEAAVKAQPDALCASLVDVLEADRRAREFVSEII